MKKDSIKAPSKVLGGKPKPDSSLPSEATGPKGPKLAPGDRLSSTYMGSGKVVDVPTDAAPKEMGGQKRDASMKPLSFGKGSSSGPNAV